MKALCRSLTSLPAWRHSFARLLAAAALLLAGAAPARAADGDLDSTFGGTGSVLTPLPAGGAYTSQFAQDAAVQADGRTVTVGNLNDAASSTIQLIRYNVNGSLDPTFGSGGRVLTPSAGGYAYGQRVFVRNDGRIVVTGGYGGSASRATAVLRYTASGAPDPTFGSGGKAIVAVGQGDSTAAAAVQADGRILVLGATNLTNSYGYYVLRLNEDGSQDSTFGNGGVQFLALPAGSNFFSDMALRPDGRIVLAGTAYPTSGSQGQIILAGLNADGTADATFGDGGTVVLPLASSGGEGANAIAVQADGKLVVFGNRNTHIAITRFLANGSIDAAFGTNGSTALSSHTSGSIALLEDGRIVYSGTGLYGRLTATGLSDTTLSPSGSVSVAGGVTGFRMRLQADHKLLFYGTNDDAGQMLLVRAQGAPFAAFANGSFEANGGLGTATATSWTLSGGASIAASNLGSGASAVKMNDTSAGVTALVTQTFGTVAGTTYVAQLDLGLYGSDAPHSLRVEAKDGVRADGATQLMNNQSGAIFGAEGMLVANGAQVEAQWGSGGSRTVSFKFTAQSTVSTLVLTSTTAAPSANSSAELDNVQVVAPPGTPVYPVNPATYGIGTPIAANTPSNSGSPATSFALTGGTLPAGLSFDPATGSITGTPQTSGTATLSVTGTNAAGTSAPASLSITVSAPPTITSIAAQTIGSGSSSAPLAFTVADPDTAANLLSVTATSSNTNLVPTFRVSFGGSGSSRTVTVGSTAGLTGSSTITLTVSDGQLTASTSFLVTVVNLPPNPPVYTPNPAALRLGSFASLTPQTSGGAATSFSISPALPAGLTFSTTSGQISGTPTAITLPRVYSVTATNSSGASAPTSLTLSTPDQTAPTFTSLPNVGTVEANNPGGAIVNYPPAQASDNSGVAPTITYSLPSGSVFPLGFTSVTVTAKDASGNQATSGFSVQVRDTTAPTITAPPNGFSPLTINATNGSGASLPDYRNQANVFDVVGANVTQSPNPGQQVNIGTTTVTLTARDNSNNSASLSFNVTVKPGNNAPSVAVNGNGTVPASFDHDFTGNSGGVPAGWTNLHLDNNAASTIVENGTLLTITDNPGNAPTFAKSPVLGGVTALTTTVSFASFTGSSVQTYTALGDLTGKALAVGFNPATKTFSAFAIVGLQTQYPFTLPSGPHVPSYTSGALSFTIAAGASSFRITSNTDHFDSGDISYASSAAPGFSSLAYLGSSAAVAVGADSGTVVVDRVAASATVLNTAVTAAAGAPATQSGTYADADGNSTVTLTSSFGAISQDSATGTWSWLGSSSTPGSIPVTITATDNANATATATFIFTVTQAAPVVAVNGGNSVPGGFTTDFTGNSGAEPSGWTNLHFESSPLSSVVESGTLVTITDPQSNGPTIIRSPALGAVSAITATVDIASITGASVQTITVLGDITANPLIVQFNPATKTFGAFVAVGLQTNYQFTLPAGPHLPSYTTGPLSYTIVAGATSFHITSPVDHYDSGAITYASCGAPGFNSIAFLGALPSVLLGADSGTVAYDRLTVGDTLVNGPVTLNVSAGVPVTQTGTFADADGNSTVTLTASTGTITQNNAAGTWSWTGSATVPGSTLVTITATDGTGTTATATFTLAVVNATPVVAVTGGSGGTGGLTNGFTGNSGAEPAGWTNLHLDTNPLSTAVESGTLLTITDQASGGGPTLLKSPSLGPVSALTATVNVASTGMAASGGSVQVITGLGDLSANVLVVQFQPSAKTFTAFVVAGLTHNYNFTLAGTTHLPSYTSGPLAYTITAGASSFRITSPVDSYDSGEIAYTSSGAPGFTSLAYLGSSPGLILGADSGVVAFDSAALTTTQSGQPGNATAVEGGQGTATGTFSDPDGNSTVTLTASTGTITQNNAAGTWTWQGVGQDGPSTSPITITATDNLGATALTSFTFTVTNGAPAVTLNGPAAAGAGSPVDFTVAGADPSTADQAASFAWSVNFGDGTPADTFNGGAFSSVSRPHTFATPGNFTVTATATDKDGGTSAPATFLIHIADTAAPHFTFVPPNVSVAAANASGAVVNYPNAQAADDVTLSPALTYSKPSGSLFPIGVTTVTVTAADAAGNQTSATFTVTVQPVFADPTAGHPISATGGLVSLAGSVSPAGGVFSGPGVTPSGTFDPTAVGPGTYAITYTANGVSQTVTITVSGPPAITPAPVATPVLTFDGQTQFVNAGPSVALANASFTIELWAKRAVTGVEQIAVSEGTGDQELYLGFRATDVFSFGFAGSALETDATLDNHWHHWAGTYDASTGARRIYRDGLLAASDTAPTAFQGSGDFIIGGSSGGSTARFQGTLSEVRVWSVARPASLIQANLYCSLAGNEAGLAAFWPLDDGAGQTAADLAVGHAHPGTLSSASGWQTALTSFGAIVIPVQTPFTDPGATAVDPAGHVLPITATNDVNANTAGFYSITYTAVDLSTGLSGTCRRAVEVIEVIAPPAPELLSPANGSYTSNPSVVLRGVAEAGNTVTLTVSGGATPLVLTVQAGANGQFTTAAQVLADGVYTVTAAAVNAAGVPSPILPASTFTVLSVPPAPPVVPPVVSPGTGTAGVTNAPPAFSGTAAPGDTITYTVTPSGGGAPYTTTATADATGHFSANAPALPDGSYTVTAVIQDPAGNVSAPSAPVTFSLDTHAPTAPVVPVVGNGGATNSSTPTFAGTAEPGSTLTFTLTPASGGAPLVLTATADASGHYSVSAPALPDGTYTVTTVATDRAGNHSAPTTTALGIDTAAPTAPQVPALGHGGAVSSATPTFSASAEPGSTVTFTISSPGGSVTLVAVADSHGVASVTTAPLGDGSYTVQTVSTDQAGNTSAPTTTTLTVDTQPPAVPVVPVIGHGGATNTPAPTFAGTAEAGSTITFTITPAGGGAPVIVTATADASGHFSASAPTLPDGSYTISTVSTDVAGNSSAATASAVTIDTAAPTAPTVPAIGHGGFVNSAAPAFAGTAEPGSTLTFTLIPLDGSAPITITATADASGHFSVTAPPLPDGGYQVTTVSTDSAGNSSAATTSLVTVDTTAPTAPTVPVVGHGGATNSHTPVFTGTAEPGSVLTFTLTPVGGGVPVIVTATADANGLFSAAAPALADGRYTVSVVSTDPAGNQSSPATSVVNVDTAAPAAPVVPVIGNGGFVNSSSPTFAGTAEPGSTLTFTITPAGGGTAVTVTVTADASGHYSAPAPAFADGTYTVSTVATDAAGNHSTPTLSSVTIDTTPPVAPLVPSVGNGGYTNSTTPTFSATAEPGSTLSFTITSSTGSATLTATADSHGLATVTTAPMTDGTYQVTTVAKDKAGNVSSTTSSSFTIDTTPPMLATHANVTVEAGAGGNSVVNYAPETATDASGVTNLTYSQASGTSFHLGVSTVNITAADAAGNSASTSFTVTVRDTTAPIVAQHENVTAEATSAAGASVSYLAATASDAVGVTSLTYSRNPGSVFPLGTTSVTVTAKDAAGNTGTGSFTVTVRDTTAPVVIPPAAVTAPATGAAGAVVTYAAATATDAVGVTSLTYSLASGSTFPIGATTVTVTAKDAAGNTGTSTFTVTVAAATSRGVIVLQPTGAGTLQLSGGTALNLGTNGSVYVNSTTAGALQISRVATVAATSIVIGGTANVSGGAKLTPAPLTGHAGAADPFASLPVPTVAGMATYTTSSIASNSTVTLQPGVYTNALSIGGSATVTLAPGTYVFMKGLSVAGSAKLNGTGVTLYLSSGAFACSGGCKVTLSAPTGGTYSGVTVFQARNNMAAVVLSGGSNSTLGGAYYVPAAAFQLSGGAGVKFGMIVASTMQLSGGSYECLAP